MLLYVQQMTTMSRSVLTLSSLSDRLPTATLETYHSPPGQWIGFSPRSDPHNRGLRRLLCFCSQRPHQLTKPKPKNVSDSRYDRSATRSQTFDLKRKSIPQRACARYIIRVCNRLTQPLDKGIFGPVIISWREACHRYLH